MDALRRHKKLPSLRSLMVKSRRQVQQTPKQMRTMLHLLSEQYGGQLQRLETPKPMKKASRGR
jgi:hypothetical protein